MAPLTNAIPKPMAPLGGSTLILNGIRKVRKTIPFLHITVGYKARMLADHVIEEGISSIFYTEGKGNAWWIFNTVLANLDEPIVVLTCDNLVELDLARLCNDYHELGSPACMVVPVRPIPGLDGDYIFHENQIVQALDRRRTAPLYCSGVQVLNPKTVTRMMDAKDDFGSVWSELIQQRQLYCSRIVPQKWFTVDTIDALAKAESEPSWSGT
jgi:NDP-sugar pyrophosphorylase family protein